MSITCKQLYPCLAGGHKIAYSCLFLLVFSFTSVQAQFVNGDFNLGTSGCNAGTSWTTGTGVTAAERTSALIGGFWVDLTPCSGWGNGAWIEQAVPTVIGNCYYVTFDLGTVCGWDGSDAGVYVTNNGTALGSKIINDSFDCTPSRIFYKNYSTQIFTATTNPTMLRFTGEGRCSYVSVLWNTCGALGGVGNPGVIAVDNFVLVPAGTQTGQLFLGNDTIFCDTFTHMLDAGPGMTSHLWSTGDTSRTITITTPGVYWCAVASPCSIASDTIRIRQSSFPHVDLGGDLSGCEGDTLLLAAPGNYVNPVYSWSTGAAGSSIHITRSGSYALTIEDEGCGASDTVNVTINPYPVVNLGNDTSICVSALPLTLRSPQPAGTHYLWSNGLSATEMEAIRGGRYWLEVTLGGCVNSDTLLIDAIPDPEVYIGADSIICEQFPLRTGVEIPGASYLWNTGQTTPYIEINRTGSYILEANLNGCRVKDTIRITSMPPPATDLGTDRDICTAQTIILDAADGSNNSYVWSTGEHTSTISVTSAGLYWVAVRSEYKCVGGDSILLTYYPEPSVALGADTTVCDETPLLLMPWSINTDSIRWSDGSTGNSLIIKYGGSYIATAVNKCGTGADTIKIEQIFCDITVPSAFTPNGDGTNDIFRVLGNPGRLEGFSFSIYSRWGERIFHTQDRYRGWDGMHKNLPSPVGTYVYMLEYSIAGKPHFLKGNFHLIR